MGTESLCFLNGPLSFGFILAETDTKLRNQFLLMGLNGRFDCQPVSQGLIGLFPDVGNVKERDVAAGPWDFNCRGVGGRGPPLVWGHPICLHLGHLLVRMYPLIWGNLPVWGVEV